MNSQKAAELLARLNATTVRFDVGQGGIPELVALDVAAACSGLDDVGYYMVRAKYCGDDAFRGQAMRELAMIMDDKQARGLKRPSDFVELQRLAEYIVSSNITDSICRKCKGVGFIAAKKCPSCNGAGKRVDSLTFMAKSCGYNRNTFQSRGYVDYVNYWVSELAVIEDRALRHIADQLTDRMAA